MIGTYYLNQNSEPEIYIPPKITGTPGIAIALETGTIFGTPVPFPKGHPDYKYQRDIEVPDELVKELRDLFTTYTTLKQKVLEFAGTIR